MIRHTLPGLIVGLLFGAGLALSGMIDPARVLGFLDVTGQWDPTLAFVLAAALAPSSLAYALKRRMGRPLLANDFAIPQGRAIDRRLIGGAALFGLGWGLIGLCPGPAVAGLVLGRWQVWLFVGAMVAGMWLQRAYADMRGRDPARLSGAALAANADAQH
jgi:uncharacterized membrane protein YedE/YeeE